MNDSISIISRPTTLDEVVGMEDNKKLIYYAMNGSKILGDPLPSFIFAGPAGTGKTTLAQVVSNLSKRPDGSPSMIFKKLASDIKTPEDLTALSLEVEDGDIVYLEEAHTLGGSGKGAKIVQATLLEWIENYKILSLLDDAPKVSFILPTTNPGKLTQALRSRCHIIHMSYYSLENIKEILYRAGLKFGIDLSIDDEALTLLAQSSRGTPRTAIMQRLDMLRKVMAVDQLEYNVETVRLALKINNVNEWGLEPNDILYCKILYQQNLESKKPTSKKTIEQISGISSDMMEEMIESYLLQIGAIRIDHGGRRLTDFGCAIIGKNFYSSDPTEEIDLDKLSKLMDNPFIRKGGMKMIANELNLRYPKDIGKMKKALFKLGLTSKQRSGIVPIKS